MNKMIYLDYAATTPVDPRVVEAMSQYLTLDGCFGNASSMHEFGQQAKIAVEQAREEVAALLHADASEIIWTSGATEANNLALKGAAQLYQQKGKHIVTVKTEHSAVLDCCQQLEKQGFQVTYLSPERNGLLDLNKLQAALRDDTILVSIMQVNNELGVIQDIKAIGAMTSQRGILLHVDAAQAAGKIPIDVHAMQIDLLSCCAHKVYGPKGVGVLYVRKKPRVRVAALLHGGGHEQGMRSGTLPVHQIVAMGKAFAIAKNEMQENFKHISKLRDIFLNELKSCSTVSINGDLIQGFPGILNISIAGKTSQEIMQALPELAISAGSACHAKGNEPSYVLRALGLSFSEAQSAVRISFGVMTTENDAKYAAGLIKKIIL